MLQGSHMGPPPVMPLRGSSTVRQPPMWPPLSSPAGYWPPPPLGGYWPPPSLAGHPG
jgi:hypothetical protein